MTFTTLTYILFLAVVVAAYWLIRARRAQNVLLIVAGYAFYCWGGWIPAVLLAVSSTTDYLVGCGLGRASRPAARKVLLAASLTVNLGAMLVFQYFDFFSANAAALAGMLGWHVEPLTLGIALRVSISFYTFQTLSYILDVYRGKQQPTASAIDYFAFMALFPRLVAGPIERAGDLLTQLAAPRRFDQALAVDGCRQILWGFVKKMVLADNLAEIVRAAYGDPDRASGPLLMLATVAYAWQLYCDFSGYTDIALGSAKLLGIRLTNNFAYPYFSQTLDEFWRRWHITLMTWLRDYLYIPLGGSRVGKVRHVANLLVVFAVSGLWHAAAGGGGQSVRWAFVAWGLINALGLLPRVLLGSRKASAPVVGGQTLLPRPAVLGRMLRTFAFVCVAWVFFRAETIEQGGLIVYRMAAGLFDGSGYLAVGRLLGEEHRMVRTLSMLAGFIAAEWFQRRHAHALVLPTWPRPLRWLLYTVLIWTALYLGARQPAGFIYAGF